MARRSHRAPPVAEPHWAYFLDIDGTLIDIAEAPDRAVADRGLLDLLQRFGTACGRALAFVSGRSLADLDRRLGDLALPLAGQHGLERRNAAGELQILTERTDALAAACSRFAALAEAHRGLLCEDKGLSLALHYRAAPRLGGYLHRLAGRLVAESAGQLCLQGGKRVIEVRPTGADKGAAIDRFMDEAPFKGRRPVFIGDDASDELGFAAINRSGGISIRVGPGASVARYRLSDVAAVRTWLAKLCGG